MHTPLSGLSDALRASIRALRPPLLDATPINLADVYLASLWASDATLVDALKAQLHSLGHGHLADERVRVNKGVRHPFGPKTSATVAAIVDLVSNEKTIAHWLNAGHFILTSPAFSREERIQYLRAQADRYARDGFEHGWLVLNGMGFEEVPPEVLAMGRLSRLHLNRNPIKTLPEGLYDMTDLVELSLEKTKLMSLDSGIGRLVNLRQLYLGGTKFTELPTEIGDLVQLETLHLEDARVRSIPPSVCKMQSLTRLFAFGSKLEDIPDVVVQQKGLSFLNVRRTPLSKNAPRMSALVELDAARSEADTPL